MSSLIQAGIIGAAGYAGRELTKILLKHPGVELRMLNSRSHAGQKVSAVYPDFRDSDLDFNNYSVAEINDMGLDVVFLALPDGLAAALAPRLRARIIDLSADHRFKSPSEAVYGLPELFADSIKSAGLVANPGCFATACLLAGLPVKQLARYAVFDCKSGWSGAGRESAYAKDKNIIKENIIAYKLTCHKHADEIRQFLGQRLSFTPHVINAFRGIMCTAHFIFKKKITAGNIKKLYRRYYADCPFIKITDGIPDIKDAAGTNYCVLGGWEMDENNQLVLIAVIDNLQKGAAGQAVQNMNIMFGLEQTTGLI